MPAANAAYKRFAGGKTLAQGGIHSRRAGEIGKGSRADMVRLGKKKQDDFAAEIASMVGGNK